MVDPLEALKRMQRGRAIAEAAEAEIRAQFAGLNTKERQQLLARFSPDEQIKITKSLGRRR
jgi:hypothetical protein